MDIDRNVFLTRFELKKKYNLLSNYIAYKMLNRWKYKEKIKPIKYNGLYLYDSRKFKEFLDKEDLQLLKSSKSNLKEIDDFRLKGLPIPYDIFLKYKHIPSINAQVEIECSLCNKIKLIKWTTLTGRINHKYEQICPRCMQLHTSKNKFAGKYYGILFESSYELMFIDYCVKNNINIKRCNISIPYMNKGKQRNYYPDFIVNDNKIVEIKGYVNSVVKSKSLGAKQFCSKNNLLYEIILLEDLKRMGIFKKIKTKEDLSFFNEKELIVSSYPYSWFPNMEKAFFPYVGFIYSITNLLTMDKQIKIAIGTNKMINCKYNKDVEFCNRNNEYSLKKIYYAKTIYELNLMYCKILSLQDKNLSFETIKNERFTVNQWKILKNVLWSKEQYKIIECFSNEEIDELQKFNYSLFNVYDLKNKVVDNIDEFINKSNVRYETVIKRLKSKKNNCFHPIIQKFIHFIYNLDLSGKNDEHNGMFGKKGKDAVNKRKVVIFDKDFNVIKKFNNENELINCFDLKSLTIHNIQGYFLIYRSSVCIGNKKVKQIDIFNKNNELLFSVDSIRLTEKILNIDRRLIKSSIDKNVCKKGFYFKYSEKREE